MGYIEAVAPIRGILRSDTMRVIVALCELRSVRATADALAMSPSAVSKQLRRVEDQIGRPLFHRSRQGVEPNEEGVDLAEIGRKFLALVEEVGARFDREMVSGRVRLGITDDTGLKRVPGLLKACAARFPGLDVELTVAYSSELTAAITEQRLDLAVVSDGGTPFPNSAIPLQPERMVWVGRAGLGRPPLPVPLAVSSEGCRWRARAIHALDAASIPWRVVCTSPATAGQLAAARMGLGVAPLPQSVIETLPDVEIMSEGLPSLPDIEMALLSAPRAGKAIRTLRDALLASFGRCERQAGSGLSVRPGR